MQTSNNEPNLNGAENSEDENTAGFNQTDEEIKSGIIEEFGLNSEDENDAQTLEKIFTREKSHRQRTSKAIEQKINWREKAEGKTKAKAKDDTKGKPTTEELVSAGIKAEMDKRDLHSLDLSDDIKESVKKVASFEGISIREAAKHPFVQAKKDEEERVRRMSNSSPAGSGGGSKPMKIDVSKQPQHADFDFSTEEGREKWKKATEAHRKWRKEQ